MTDTGYIRGGGAVSVDPRRIAIVLGAIAVIGLAVATVLFAVGAASDRSVAGRLRAHGVPVQVTVSGCRAVSSGIGMGIQYYSCEGTYTVDGSTGRGVVHGSRAQHRPGDVLAGVVVPGRPSTLTLAGAVGRTYTYGWAVPIVLGLLTLIGAAGLALAGRRLRRRRRATGGA